MIQQFGMTQQRGMEHIGCMMFRQARAAEDMPIRLCISCW